MKWFRSKEEKRLKALMEELQNELEKSSVLAVETAQKIHELEEGKRLLRSRLDNTTQSLVETRAENCSLEDKYKKLLDKSIEHTEADIYLQCAKIMEAIQGGKTSKEMDFQTKLLESSKSIRDDLYSQRQALVGMDALERQRGGRGQADCGGFGLHLSGNLGLAPTR